VHERKLISLLLNYGDTMIKKTFLNDQGEEDVEENYVAAYIVADLMNDNLSFEIPLYQEIYEIYKTKLLEGEIINSNYFCIVVEMPSNNDFFSSIDTMKISYNVSVL
jgi:hypothetical protein